MLLGETAEASGFRPKPAESQPVGMSPEEEFGGVQQGLQEPLSGSRPTETEPVCESGKQRPVLFLLLGLRQEFVKAGCHEQFLACHLDLQM